MTDFFVPRDPRHRLLIVVKRNAAHGGTTEVYRVPLQSVWSYEATLIPPTSYVGSAPVLPRFRTEVEFHAPGVHWCVAGEIALSFTRTGRHLLCLREYADASPLTPRNSYACLP